VAAAVMTAVGIDVADLEPSAFVAVTLTRNVLPTESLPRVMVELVAIGPTQLPPLALHRCQW